MAKIAMYQMANEGSVEQNLRKSLTAIQKASEEGADLILFPEVQLMEFFPQYRHKDVSGYSCEIDSEIIFAFRRSCRENHIMAVPNIYLRENGKCYDASILIGRDGEILSIQKMVHVAQADQFYEQDYYTPSDDGFHVCATDIGKIGIVVCFDRHYPESVRTETLMGADLILVPTVNVKTEPMEMFEWEIRVQAFQNSVAVCMCNRVGKEGGMEFAGESLFINAQGGRVLKADDRERLLIADMDLAESAVTRTNRPYTNLRHRDYYL